MIVDSMTYDEILDLYWADKPLVNHKMDAGSKFYGRMLKNARVKDRIHYKPIKFKSQRGFNYVMMFFNLADDVPGKERLGCNYYAWFIKNRGMYAITLSTINRTEYHNTIYHPHFFERYRERFLKDMSMSKPEVLHTYITNNPKSLSSKIPSAKYEGEYWMAVHDGLCLCRVVKGSLVEVKTFITWEMAGHDQKEFAFMGRQIMLERGLDVSLPDEDFEEFTKVEE